MGIGIPQPGERPSLEDLVGVGKREENIMVWRGIDEEFGEGAREKIVELTQTFIDNIGSREEQFRALRKASFLKILSPDLAERINFGIDHLDDLKDEIDLSGGLSSDDYTILFVLKSLDTEQFEDLNFDDIWEATERSLERALADTTGTVETRLMWDLPEIRIVFPQQYEDFIAGHKERVSRCLQASISGLKKRYESKNWNHFIFAASMLRIAVPEAWEQVGIKFTLEDIEDMKRHCQKEVDGGFPVGVNDMAGLKILLAKKVEVTEKGVRLQMPGESSYESEISKRPIRPNINT